MALPDPPVDTLRERSVSFGHPAANPRVHPSGERSLVPVAAGQASIATSSVSGAHGDDVSGFPIQYAKVQPPPLREETLARHRLLDWLAAKIHHRIILVLADAGYGKTTLLADFAGRTRLRTLWYRLDEDDRDWISVLHHLVAAGREADPTFAPNTAAMLADKSLSGPTRDTVIEVFIRELQSIAPHGAILIFDDFHLVDEAPDVQLIVRELVTRAPERLTMVFASRRSPGIPIAKLRAVGEVAELTRDDLRFDAEETSRLFAESYGRTLEPDVLAVVTARTEGWAASLQLVHAALRDRTPIEIRTFVRNLSGGDQELYDYLAEEVVGDLPEDLQMFLMRTAILQVVTPELAEVVTGQSTSEVSRLMAAAERVTLLGRRARGPRTELRYHPLVREFLEARLARDFGVDAVRDLHRTVASHAESRDWRIAAHHHWAAGDHTQAYAIIDASAQIILGRGEYLVAAPFVADVADDAQRASFQVVLSRRDFKQGDIRQALARAKRAVEMDSESDVALANLASLFVNSGDFELALAAARHLLDQTTSPVLMGIAAGTLAIVECSVDGDIAQAVAQLRELAVQQRRSGDVHFEGITYLNLSDAQRAIADIPGSIESATKAIELLQASSAGAEVSAAQAILGWDLAHEGDLDLARREIKAAFAGMNDAVRFDVLYEAADAEATYGDLSRAREYLSELETLETQWTAHLLGPLATLVATRQGHILESLRISEATPTNRPTSLIAYKSRVLANRAEAKLAALLPDGSDALKAAADHAMRQKASLWVEHCAAIRAATGDDGAFSVYVRTRARAGGWTLSRIAELVANRLDCLGETEGEVVQDEVRRRPERWRTALRIVVDADNSGSLHAARLLEQIGTTDDVPRLRRLARRYRGRPDSELGRALARRIATRVVVEDQGRVSMTIGVRHVDGSSIRRKVLALLCFLLTRPRFSATRDEVMDALWPEFDPADALNSLNQTVYFLRRVFEPDYKDDLSPGYLHHESDVIWLDTDLVDSRSHRCLELIRLMSGEPSPSEVGELASVYQGIFALDFAYEEWAEEFRTALHSSYLQIIEKAVASDTVSGHFERGIGLARRALDLTPEADQIELSLLRLYRLNGSHSAAAEQYSHYAAAIRETLGIEPPSLESL
jgi:ATP/maltotriose-dependent transcriptional regulator MalT/DNA-binding SARP family transcriptional activator